MKTILALLAALWTGWWFTPDQQGQRLFRRGDFAAAAASFRDPAWQGAAWYRAGEFAHAATAFARGDGAEARFNQGNALLMHGDYAAAIAAYDRALELHPAWEPATRNRGIAVARARQVDVAAGETTGGMLGADRVVFDSGKQGSSQQTVETAGGQGLSDQQIQALWLQRVQTRPADFLKAKFARQHQLAEGGR